MRSPLTRRRLLGTAAVLTATAGCVSSGTTRSSEDGREGNWSEHHYRAVAGRDRAFRARPRRLAADANGYDGTIPRTGLDNSVAIWVGEDVTGNDEYMAFDQPPSK